MQTIIIFESNHDVDRLMHTKRPMFLKQRILSDNGHLNNEDSSLNLTSLINAKTKNIVLAHLSEEANTQRSSIGYIFELYYYERTYILLELM